ncbi:hypothetical protein [Bradyrhizobium sp. CCBAU 51627]|uniref:hypothetical protein n=1 Tax=Bradyrhizobium sp. CCBAU 51627 TaxID=1325088 RepID=UPI002306842D|nr:hypothetical protein [Bradyrhizobium sp. CCBAU 51627]MDA9433522.1 hypothetical protein [Bradyrhizobium sp. CCBAU 51627]
MMTFGRQATLGKFLIKKRDETIKELNKATSYLALTSSWSLTPDHETFHHQAYLGAVYSAFEGYLLDIASEMLECFPDKLKDSDIKLQDYVKNANDFIVTMVEKQTDSLGYKRFEVISETVMKYFQPKPFKSTALPVVQEFKATRDLYVHNGGRWNAIYQSKAGPNARTEPSSGKPLPLDVAYLKAGTDAAITFINDFHAQGPRQYERYTRVKAFEQMWTTSALESVMKFTDAWSVEAKIDMARPSELALSWAWSHSEKRLFDFFLAIYAPDHPDVKYTIQEAIARWPVETDSGQVMLSWLRSPFYF